MNQVDRLTGRDVAVPRRLVPAAGARRPDAGHRARHLGAHGDGVGELHRGSPTPSPRARCARPARGDVRAAAAVAHGARRRGRAFCRRRRPASRSTRSPQRRRCRPWSAVDATAGWRPRPRRVAAARWCSGCGRARCAAAARRPRHPGADADVRCRLGRSSAAAAREARVARRPGHAALLETVTQGCPRGGRRTCSSRRLDRRARDALDQAASGSTVVLAAPLAACRRCSHVVLAAAVVAVGCWASRPGRRAPLDRRSGTRTARRPVPRLVVLGCSAAAARRESRVRPRGARATTRRGPLRDGRCRARGRGAGAARGAAPSRCSPSTARCRELVASRAAG